MRTKEEETVNVGHNGKFLTLLLEAWILFDWHLEKTHFDKEDNSLCLEFLYGYGVYGDI